MSNTEHLLSKMNVQYQNFSKGQKKLAAYIKENYDKAAFLTAAKLGETVGVSESTVVRFATHLGYKGYPEFQREGRAFAQRCGADGAKRLSRDSSLALGMTAW